MVSTAVAQGISFVAQVGTSYLLSRITAQDGPRLEDLGAGDGDYGAALPRAYGANIRYQLPLLAQADIKETEHEVEDYSEVVGAISGAAQGFLVGGPVGAVVGAVVGFIGGALAPDQKYYTYSATLALLIADRTNDYPIEGLSKLFANGRTIFDASQQSPTAEVYGGDGRLIYREYGKNKYCGKIRIYGGGFDQTADPSLEAEIGDQPGYRGRAYVVLDTLQLENFGNNVPSPFDGLVNAKTGETLQTIVTAISAEAGIAATRDLSTAALPQQEVRGYAITAETNCWDAMKPFFPVYRVDASEVGGQVRFFGRDQGIRASVPVNDMGAHEYGSTPPEKIEFTREYDVELPQETSLSFLDPERDYQPNTASSRRSEGDARSNVSLDLAIVLNADEGATAAATAHWDAWLGRTSAEFAVTDQWISLEPGRVYALPVAGQRLPYRVSRRTRGANGIIEVEALSDENVTYTGTVNGAPAPVPTNTDTLLANTVVVPMDMPMQSDAHDDFGFYVAMGATSASWTRGRVEVSGDGVNFATLLDYTESATMGAVDGTLAAGSTDGLDDTLDTTTVLTVNLLHSGMSLESTTDTLLDAYENFAFVGKDGQGEYLQFKTATQVGPTTWELTNLRRGRRGTDHAIAAHGAGEQFVLLGGGGIYRIPVVDNSGWGDTLVLRGVTLHQDAVEAATVTFANTGEGKRPFSPYDLTGSFNGGGDLDLTWTNRSRFFGTDTDTPVTFEIDFVRAGVVVRTESVTATDYSYLAADQASDGFAEGDAIVVRLYRVNDNYGRSRVRASAFIAEGFALTLEDGATAMLLEDDLTPIGLG